MCSKSPLLYDYTVSNELLPRSESVIDLGVTFDCNLSFRDHVAITEARAVKSMGFIIRNSRDFSNPETLITLFNSLVRSRLEYASIIWSPTYDVHIDTLENILRKFLKFTCFKLDGVYPCIGYPQSLLLQRFGLSSLESRRKYASVLFLYKLINAHIDCPDLLGKINLSVPRLSARFPCTFYAGTAHTRALQSSPLYSMYSNYHSIQDSVDIFHTSAREIRESFSAAQRSRS